MLVDLHSATLDEGAVRDGVHAADEGLQPASAATSAS
jgi:hypothetical protein